MTRNEVIKCFKKHLPAVHNPNNVIDFYIETGMLKVEEEKTVEDKIRGAFAGRTIQGDLDLINLCNKYGLKIVEKDK